MLYPQQNAARNLMQLDGFWDFQADMDQVGEQNGWFKGLQNPKKIAVPGSWNEQYSELFGFMGIGWYQKEVFIPASWSGQSIWIRVGSACYKAKVWVNGQFIGSHEGGHLPFQFNMMEYAEAGTDNLVTILVDASLDPWALPPASLEAKEARIGFFNSNPPVSYDFYPYGGIHRPVYLYSTNLCRIEEITITTEIKESLAVVHYNINLSEKITGKIQLATADILEEVQVEQTAEIKGTLQINDPKLWGIGEPNLYTLKVNVYAENALVDSYKEQYGIRTVSVEKNKLLLNGKEVFLNGFGKHEDFHVIGKGLNHALIVKDFDLMHWIGANSFRTSHYPYAEEMLDYADQHGILVINETPFVGLNERMYTDEILLKAKGVIKELISRDKNHPSVIMWSLANEPNVNSEAGERFFREMAETARNSDQSRPLTYAAHLEPENNRGMKHYDVVCINKYYGWYMGPGDIDGTLSEFSKCMDRFYEAFEKPMILAEFGADAIAGMHHEPAQMFSEEFQAEIIMKQYQVFKEKTYAVGAHVWNFADFKTAQSISRIIYNRKGVFTRERQPKLAAHKLRELWRDRTNE